MRLLSRFEADAVIAEQRCCLWRTGCIDLINTRRQFRVITLVFETVTRASSSIDVIKPNGKPGQKKQNREDWISITITSTKAR